MDGQRAVFERGMLAQHLLLFRTRARSKRYMNMPRGLGVKHVHECELACLRCRQLGTSATPSWSRRRQASAHIG
ncbi:hypothetical protein CQ014_06480 [Pseudomonas lurida]|nr:hypothetical protein CLM75_03840 [Pseudomonas lurida]PRA18904.1 hypothetical protein CQ002_06460 [Pseudomonas sp. MYb13]PRA24611.1 hypothetical protein CQ004_06480 [Pseudomonas lurida]PRA38790.1 hypothetical protein CQ005_02320 [Pseudomonas lurida]PRC03555.1 hypothetical protein CQ014_06480 [Pseudomonas lurida]